jgi:hypothetical protein
MKSTVAKRNLRIAILLLAMMLPLSASAASTGFCKGLVGGFGVASPTNSYATLSGMLGISYLLILIMAAIVGIAYALGTSLHIDALTRFSKTEIGEIIVTLLIISLMLGSFAIVNSTAPSSSTSTSPNSYFALGQGAFNSSRIFLSDCGKLAYSAIDTIPQIVYFSIYTNMWQFISSVSLSYAPDEFGPNDEPFVGAYVLVGPADMVLDFASGLAAILIGVEVILALIYSLFPFFLFLGIVLRTMPWTRAAGGSFLGLFIGFYIMLPLMLNLLLAVLPTTTSSALSVPTSISGLFSTLQSQFSNVLASLSSVPSGISGLFNFNATAIFIKTIGSQMLYDLLAVILSIIVAFDFTETMGDLLGAPSLTSSGALKNLI